MNLELDTSAKYRNDPRSTDELIHLVLTLDADRDNDNYWIPIAVLQHRLPGIWERVRELGGSSDEKDRSTSATILGQGWVGTKPAAAVCADDLLRMLAREQSPSVLASIIIALGHLHDRRSVGPLADLQSHPAARVRHAVVSSLGGFEEPQAIEVLIKCSADEDRDVRDWATFGLGTQIDADTPAIREALRVRLEEGDDEIRGEALVGLARRGDIRVLPALLKEMHMHSPDVLRDWILIRDAGEAVIKQANASGLKVWQPVLNRLAELNIGNQDELQAAINRITSSSK